MLPWPSPPIDTASGVLIQYFGPCLSGKGNGQALGHGLCALDFPLSRDLNCHPSIHKTTVGFANA